jgi:hypothetical protein
MTRQIITGIVTAAALFIAGCSTTSSVQPTDNSITGAKGGTLRLSFSSGDEADGLVKNIFNGAHGDAEAVEHIWVTIKEVQIHTSGNAEENGWKTVATPGARFDFLELVNGLTAPLGLHALPAGHYTQIRLFLEDQVENEDGEYPNAVVINGESFPLTIPSVYKTGIKCVRSFFIEEDEVTEICLRFDVIKAIHYSEGNGYMMHPAYQTYKCDGSDDSEDQDDSDDDEEFGDDYEDYYYETYYEFDE